MSKIEFPRWIYKGKTEQKIVKNIDEYQTALAEGWRKGVIDEIELDAIGGDANSFFEFVEKRLEEIDALQVESEAPEAPDEPLSYREMLEANAKKLNIKFGIKTSNSQLAAMIQRRG